MVYPSAIKNYIRSIDSPGELHGSENTSHYVFSKLINEKKNTVKLVDEIHIKPAARYQGNHVIGYSHDESSKPVGTC